MQCIHEVKITRRVNMPVLEFLASCHELIQKAGECRLSVLDYLAGCFLPVLMEGESREDWIIRQVEEILESELVHDEMGRHSNARPAHFHHRTRNVRMSDEDRGYLAEMLSNHPDVQACWLRIESAQFVNAA